ncbi:MAG: osmoprotectant transport system permease protein [Chloroflexota bacterium]|jgi:osmoprotectant transport system permease protein|nr:osmoprotectant transport system permease protein [Chloroflexota bacterium]
MSLFVDTLKWLTDPAHYQGSDAIQTRILEHLELSGFALIVAAAIALPVGLYLGHTGRFGFLAVTVANIGRAVPSFAILGLVLPPALSLGLGLGFWPTVIALIPLAIPPMLTNAYAGTRGVDRDVIEAGRGMGLSESGILRRIEIPLALPLVVAGVRTSAVNVVATATLGALVASGGLGRYIIDGFALRENDRLFAGALLVALLAIVVEVALGTFERLATSPGIRAERAAL